ncbi:MAG: LPS-assembly protein LptD [Alphaproteobacteria bacterium]
MRRFTGNLLIAVLVLLMANLAVAREQLSSDLPVLMMADEMNYDEELGTAVARGKVEIVQGERSLFADIVSYNQKTDTVSASGNVVLHEPSGEVVFAEYVELNDQLKTGVIERIQILLRDESRFAAYSAERKDGNKTRMHRAVFSPCKLCEKDPDAPPLWQLKAERVEHDQEAREIRYKDVYLEMWGFPVAYSPYLSHPDPTVDRKAGFLAPDFGTGGNVGAFLRLPYFIPIGGDKDVTLDPIYTRDEGLVLSGQYRQQFKSGELALSGSIAEALRREGDADNATVKGDRIRGHFTVEGAYHFDETWRAKLDVRRASDSSYLRKFDFFKLNRNTLRSHANVEGFRQRNYMAANAYWFQDLRSDSRAEQPIVAPVLDFKHMGEADRLGGRWQLDANLRTLFRDEGADSQRISFKPRYQVGRAWNLGLVTTATATTQIDGYRIGEASISDDDETFKGRIFPQMAIEARYPFVRHSENLKQVIEPIALGILAPNGSNPEEILDEESTVFELDDTNLLSLDRFSGLDKVDSGSRMVYGAKFGLYGETIGDITGFLGQSYRFHTDRDLRSSKLLEEDFSDYVGRIDVKPNQYVDLLYRFRFSESDFSTRSSAVGFSIGPRAMSVSGNYVFVEEGTAASNSERREELQLALSSRINRFWSASLRTHRDLADNGGSLAHTLRARYEDECFAFETTAQRSFTRDADIEPESRILFRLIFRHLGQVQSSAG